MFLELDSGGNMSFGVIVNGEVRIFNGFIEFCRVDLDFS